METRENIGLKVSCKIFEAWPGNIKFGNKSQFFLQNEIDGASKTTFRLRLLP